MKRTEPSATTDLMQPRGRQAWLVKVMRDEGVAPQDRRKAAQMLARSMRGRFGLQVELSPGDVATLNAFARGERPSTLH